MPLINEIAVRLRFPISIWICTYLRVSSSSLETDILYFTFKNVSRHYVLVLHLVDDGFAFV